MLQMVVGIAHIMDSELQAIPIYRKLEIIHVCKKSLCNGFNY